MFYGLVIFRFSYLVTRASNNGWEDSTRSIISCETSLAHTGSVVNDKSSSVFVTHFEVWFSKICWEKERIYSENCVHTTWQFSSEVIICPDLLYIVPPPLLSSFPLSPGLHCPCVTYEFSVFRCMSLEVTFDHASFLIVFLWVYKQSLCNSYILYYIDLTFWKFYWVNISLHYDTNNKTGF